MEKVKKMLEAQRVSFTRIYDAVITLLGEKNINLIEIRGNVRILDQKIELIADLGRQLLDHILESESSEESILLSEIESADNFLKKYHELKLIVESHSPNHSDETSNVCSTHTKRKLKLPTIEFKKFGGDIRDWLPFWSQFKRIHDDEDLPVEDKFQYLLQAMVPSSRARQLVESYPPSGDNYPKVIESLESRFGRKDLLVEVYVRELLKLVLTSIGNRNKLSFLYDKLESQLRSLETLDVTSDTCAAMLYPLVESCLPEDLIRVWQRSSHYDVESTLKIRLDNLMIFLRKEVENEERITLAVAGFDMQSKTKKIVDCPPVKNALPTASGLMNNKFQKKCHFCNGSHCSGDCSDARNWTLADRKKKLIERGCCFLCLKYGHIARKCRVNSVCSICNGRHVDIMCTKTDETTTKFVPAPKQSNVENSLSNNTYAEVFLQTLRVRLNGLNKSRMARVIIDTGSQRSYIKQSVASEMLYESIRREEMVHALFGGTNTDVCNHHCYRIRLSSIHDDYASNFEALDQTVICNNVTSVRQGPWMDELSSLGIEISDKKDGPVDILIGADIAGKLLTGKRHELKCGLVALHTLLGWTIMGKVTSNKQSINSSMLVVTTMLNRDLGPTDLCRLDVLGITDPLQQKSKKDTEKAVMEHFLETVLRKEDGRYEVHMPWIEGHPPLPNNFSIAQRRLENLMKKLNNDGCSPKQLVESRWWERLIRIIKDLLRKVLGKSSLTYEELYTIVCDTESVVNSRPLTYFHEDSRDLVPLTPAMFLREIQEVGVPDVYATEATDLRKHLRYRLKLKEDLRRRFRTEYLGELKLFSKGNNVKDIRLGDIVLVGLDNIKRLDWPLARIEEMIPGRDGKIRVVRLKTATGSLLRPVQRIYPLEINSRDNEIDFHALNKIGQEKIKEEKGTKRDREPEEQKNEKDDKPAHEKKPVVTRYGRIVKPPSKYTG
ncbi:uncharacterized protein LOC123682465 [Harmonia axyridis]|uniref:uncharacterized protein LOC123682465 n=1 Tax=Harmonia axyridis TaxID=115357 RepID=UPI001E277F60|nr:uncharacterized protein LOC123682465 [Harmonia axyridis]